MRRPVIIVAPAFLAGILLGQAFLHLPLTTLLISALLLPLVLSSPLRARLRPMHLFVLLTAILCGAFLFIRGMTIYPEDRYTRLGLADGSVHQAYGRIDGPLERDPGRTAFPLAIDAIDGRRASGTIRVSVAREDAQFGYGDHVAISGRLLPVHGSRNPGGFDYPGHMARQGVFAVLSVGKKEAPLVLERGTGPFRAIQDLRERIRLSFRNRFTGDGASILQAMILGEEGDLTAGLRDRFLAAGATHILSISGSHLGLVALICFWSARNALFLLPERTYHRLTLAIDPRKVAALLTVLPVTFYALLAGGEEATMRSLIMLLAGIGALLADRDHDLSQALALAGLIILVPSPQAAFDISFQLSFLSVAAILFVVNTTAALPRPASWKERISRDALVLMAVSVSATLATAPLVIAYFNRLSVWGILSNMIIVPFAGFLVVPIGLTDGLLSLFLGRLPLAGLDQAVADAFVGITTFFARLPGAILTLPAPGIPAAAGYGGLVLSLALLIRKRLLARFRPLEHPRTPALPSILFSAASLAVLLAAVLLPRIAGHPSRITFIDVGQGDSTLIETACGVNILIDGGGTRDNRFDVGRKVVAPFLWNKDIRRVDLAILSHPHPDHMNGLASLLSAVPATEFLTSGRDLDLEGYADLLRSAEQRNTVIRPVRRGDRVAVGNAVIEVLSPSGEEGTAGRAYERENDRSLVLAVTIEGKRFLFPGDVHRSAERSLLRSGMVLASDCIKVPHHGSRTSSSQELIDAVHPSLAVVSVGASNPYRQPSDEVLDRYAAASTRLLRTDRDGAVTVIIEKDRMEAYAWTSLILRPIDPTRPEIWWSAEQENWERLRIRRAVI